VRHSLPNPPSPPPLAFGLLEGWRATGELLWFQSSRRWLARNQRGDGRPVLVLPGLVADDLSTRPLRRLLKTVGYSPYAWGLRRNVGPTRRIVAGLDARLKAIYEQHGRPVSVVGQSLGGIMGRDLAIRHPGLVDRIISLASPVSMTSLAQSRAHWTYDLFSAHHLPEYAVEEWTQQPAPDVPATSVYSRSDGVCHWEASRYPDGPLTENIEIYASHCGMGVHPAAVYAVLDRLAADVDAWQRFTPPALLQYYFRVEGARERVGPAPCARAA
jgi:pimeloyl-ACP methyl ester carboxylesterase